MAASDFLIRLNARAAPLKQALERWRTPIVAAALALFVGGTVWAFIGLSLSLAQLDLTALAVLTLGMGAVTVGYSALSLSLLARTAGARLPFVAAMRATARAQMAEALPLPGGAIVRTAALVSAGVPAARSAALVIGTALLWIALAALAAGAILIASAPLAGWALVGSGAVVTIAALTHVARLGGGTNAALTLLHRLGGLGLAALRLWLSFAVIKSVLPLTETFPYVLAAIAGSASSLVPGGLGVSEALGALMASAVNAPPESAFLAVAINRITQFLGTAIYAPFLEWRALPRSLPENR